MTWLVRFLPQDLTTEALPGDTILDVALSCGVDLPHECGGNCACTTCHVIIEAGDGCFTAMEEVEVDRISCAEGLTSRSRLGCQAIFSKVNDPSDGVSPIEVTVVGIED